MGFNIDVAMVGSAPSLAAAAEAVLGRVGTLGLRLQGRFYETGGEHRETAFAGAWAASVNAWSGVAFSVAAKGPLLSVVLKKVAEKIYRATVSVSGSALQTLYANRLQHVPVFYAPVLQVALALGSRAGLGDLDSALETFSPKSDQDVEQAVAKLLKSDEEPGRLAFLRREPGKPRPPATFIITERPEGYWILEHPNLLEILSTD